MIRFLAFLALLVGLSAPANAQNCRLALLLALDVSSSVDAVEDRQQREGLAAALIDPEVMDAILAPGGHVTLAAYEWSGRYKQSMVLDWTVLDTPAAVLAAAERISGSQRAYGQFPTAAGFALSHAAALFKAAPKCDRRTLDVSGDGVNNDGYPPSLVHKNGRLSGVTVNGLVIGGANDTFAENDMALMIFFRDEVINGPGAFVEFAKDYSDYARAMQRKLLREVRQINLAGLRP